MTADAVGGVWTYAAELSEQLAERGDDVVIAALGPAPAAEQLALAPSAEILVWEGALEWMPDPWDDVARSGEWLLELHDELRPDVVHLNGYAHAALGFRSPVVVVAHSCVLSWFRAVRGHAAPPEWTRYRREVERGLRAADTVVAPTQAMLAALRREYSFATTSVVIPNGRRTPRPGRKLPFVLAAGRAWDEAKNIGAVERVAPRLSWPIRIVGDGSDAGHVSQRMLTQLFATASIFAAPALYEPFGLTALEAGGAGCALVLGDIPSLREVWDDAALYVDPQNDDELAHVLQRLIDDGGMRERLATAAHARAKQFTPERMTDAYCDLYDRVAAGARA